MRIDESTDAYDTVAWLIKNVAGNNGRVGVVGTSYPGFLAMMAGIDPNPAVKAISPQAPMIDVWIGDDFFHNGAFRQSYGYDYVLGMESSKKRTAGQLRRRQDGKPVDGFDYFLKRGSFVQDAKQSGSRMLPTWKLFLDHPAYDSVWSSRGVEYALNSVTVPTLTVGGYYDQEDMYGPQEEYAKLEPHDSRTRKLSRSRAVAAWLLVVVVAPPGQSRLWRAHRHRVSHANRGEIFRALSQRRAGLQSRRHCELSNRLEYLEVLCALSPGGIAATSLHLAGAGMLSWKRVDNAGQPHRMSVIRPTPFPIVTGPSSRRIAPAPSGTTGSLRTSDS